MSFTAIVVFLQILHYRPDLADRVSFRLSVATNISDLFFSLFHLTIILYKTPGPLCSIVGWGWAFFSLTSVFYTVCIAINLQLIFIYEYKGRHNLEKYYFLCPILLALFFSLLPLTQNMWGYSVTEGICWYRNSDDISTILWQWFTLFAWITLSFCKT
ncbi:hypothetical protein G9A89_008474 [Geosiphon pyriformis]|nr:hypothetical protein G9A89_008474 [Geosiphon pyriformis]